MWTNCIHIHIFKELKPLVFTFSYITCGIALYFPPVIYNYYLYVKKYVYVYDQQVSNLS